MKQLDAVTDSLSLGTSITNEQFDKTVETSGECDFQRRGFHIGWNTKRFPRSDPVLDVEQSACSAESDKLLCFGGR
jgi:hypothetical protein